MGRGRSRPSALVGPRAGGTAACSQVRPLPASISLRSVMRTGLVPGVTSSTAGTPSAMASEAHSVMWRLKMLVGVDVAATALRLQVLPIRIEASAAWQLTTSPPRPLSAR